MSFDTPVGCECNECKRCKNRIKAKRWREKNKERTKQYYLDNRDRINEVSRQWKKENPERVVEHRREYGKEYRKRPEVIERNNELDKNRRSDPSHRDRIDARKKLQRAVKNGKIERQPCEVCGATEDIHGHHEDYSKPYDVVWLCVTHHVELHRRKYEEENGLGNANSGGIG